jgi:hypothetical protein
MIRIGFNLYRDRWVLTSSLRSAGGGRLDAPPVRLVPHADTATLLHVLTQLAAEDVPVVPQPDWNDPIYKVGIRAHALGLKSWLSFVRDARSFNLEERGDGLVLEEWPREGGSFTARASWQKTFAAGDLPAVAAYLVENIAPITAPHAPMRKRRAAVSAKSSKTRRRNVH